MQTRQLHSSGLVIEILIWKVNSLAVIDFLNLRTTKNFHNQLNLFVKKEL